jgi:hypothetical protein
VGSVRFHHNPTYFPACHPSSSASSLWCFPVSSVIPWSKSCVDPPRPTHAHSYATPFQHGKV